MVTSAKLVASELRVPVVQTFLGTVLTSFCVPRGPRFGGAAGRGPRGTQKLIFSSARTDHYENIFEAFSLPARTFTKIFSKRFSARADHYETFLKRFSAPITGRQP